MEYGKDLKKDYLEEGYSWVWDIDSGYGEIERIYGSGEVVWFENDELEEVTEIEVNERANRAYKSILRDITENVPSEDLLKNYGRIAVRSEGDPRAVGLTKNEAELLDWEIGPLVNEALERKREIEQS